MVSAIVCVDNNWGIGYQGELLASIPEDMKFFKEKTNNSIVIMGRKTYDSLRVKPLPNRINIVITSNIDSKTRMEVRKDNTIYTNIEFVKAMLINSELIPLDIYIIGGGQIYKELLPYCHTSYITKINHSYKNVDAYFPNLDKMENWKMWTEEINNKKEYHGLEYEFCIYESEMM